MSKRIITGHASKGIPASATSQGVVASLIDGVTTCSGKSAVITSTTRDGVSAATGQVSLQLHRSCN